MKQFGIIFICIFGLFNCSNAQNLDSMPTVDWAYFVDAYNTTVLSDLEVDSTGNTYFSVNYMGRLTMDGLNLKMPNARHQIGLLTKLDKNGKPLWSRAFKSDFDCRIKDICLAPNGDIIATGFTDEITDFPSSDDTLRLGEKKPKGRYHRNYYVYITRYAPDGTCKWAKLLQAPWSEAHSAGVDSKGNIYWSMYHRGTLKDGKKVLDSIPHNNSADRFTVFKLSPDGEIVGKLPLRYVKKNRNNSWAPRVTIDRKDNVIVYGLFKKGIELSSEDSLTNDGYYEGRDAFIAKYNPEGEFLWSTKIGGQSSEVIHDLRVDKKNRIYVTGEYRYECVISNGISLIQKSMFKYKSGSSFFYARFLESGKLDFVNYAENNGYGSTVMGTSLEIDDKGYTYITGGINDTFNFNSNLPVINTQRDLGTNFTSIWKEDTIIQLRRDIEHGWSWVNTNRVRINDGKIVHGGYYYLGTKGEAYVKLTNGKKVPLSNYEHGAAVVVYGGNLPKLEPVTPPHVEKDSFDHLFTLKPITDCFSPLVEQAANVWFPIKQKDTADFLHANKDRLECGLIIKQKEAKLYPNPTKDKTTLELSGLEGMVRIDIYSEKGDLMLSQQVVVKEDVQTFDFDMSHAAEGLYFVSVTRSGYRKVFRLIRAK